MVRLKMRGCRQKESAALRDIYRFTPSSGLYLEAGCRSSYPIVVPTLIHTAADTLKQGEPYNLNVHLLSRITAQRSAKAFCKAESRAQGTKKRERLHDEGAAPGPTRRERLV